MCILLKLHYAKFDVSILFSSKVIGEKPLGGVGSTPNALAKERLMSCFQTSVFGIRRLDKKLGS